MPPVSSGGLNGDSFPSLPANLPPIRLEQPPNAKSSPNRMTTGSILMVLRSDARTACRHQYAYVPMTFEPSEPGSVRRTCLGGNDGLSPTRLLVHAFLLKSPLRNGHTRNRAWGGESRGRGASPHVMPASFPGRGAPISVPIPSKPWQPRIWGPGCSVSPTAHRFWG